MTDIIRNALESCRPQIAARCVAIIRNRFDAMVEVHGARLDGIHNSREFASVFRETIRAVVRKVPSGTYEIDQDALDRCGAAHASVTIEAWRRKLTSKLGDIENAAVRHLDGCGFVVSGSRDGRAVEIEQRMIVNVSAKGTIYNQFPAGIRVDGKVISEADYKRL